MFVSLFYILKQGAVLSQSMCNSITSLRDTGSITKATAVPGTSLFFTGSKDGDVKLWDVTTRSMVGHWPKVHERHTFLQVNSRSLGSIIQVHLLYFPSDLLEFLSAYTFQSLCWSILILMEHLQLSAGVVRGASSIRHHKDVFKRDWTSCPKSSFKILKINKIINKTLI